MTPTVRSHIIKVIEKARKKNQSVSIQSIDWEAYNAVLAQQLHF